MARTGSLRRISCGLVASALGLLLASTSQARPPLETAAQIQACVEANMPERTSVQTVVFRARDRIGSVNESRATIHWKRFEGDKSRVLIRFSAPPDLRKAAVLMLDRKPGQRDMFLYLPALDRVKRITSRMMSGSMFGTDFTYEEFERFQDYAPTARATRLPDADHDGGPVYVIESRPTEDEVSSYTRIVEYVDPETCVRLKSELFERGDRLRKVATSVRADLARAGDLDYARRMVMRDLRDETQTELVIEEVEVGVDIPRKAFSQAQLARGGTR